MTEPNEAGSHHVAAGAGGETLVRVREKSVNLAIWRRSLDPGFAAALADADLAMLDRYDGAGTPGEIGAGLTAALPASGLAEDVTA